MIKRFVLFVRSNTQRVVVQIDKDSALITKEWRKSVNEDWVVGKGITIPTIHLINLGKFLDGCVDNYDYELLQEDNHDNDR